MEASLEQLEARIRYELDPRQRLRRDGPKLAAALAVAVVVGAVYVARSRRRRRSSGSVEVDWIAAMPEEWRQRLQELLSEAAATGTLPAQPGKPAGKRPLALSLAFRAARMAAPGVMAAAAERIGRRPADAAQGQRQGLRG
jgi:hypothetical protein